MAVCPHFALAELGVKTASNPLCRAKTLTASPRALAFVQEFPVVICCETVGHADTDEKQTNLCIANLA